MVFFNWATMQMAAKIVYYGPGLCGKTSNLSYIYAKTAPNSRGEMVSLETESDRTLFFDLLPIEVGTIGGFKTRLQLYTVPGQVFYNTTRKLVLKGVDGLVFVADSQRAMREANLESISSLKENLAELSLELGDLPLVFQFNKRDLKNTLAIEELYEDLNSELDVPYFAASAINGDGVFETLKEITKLTLKKLRKRMASPQQDAGPRPRLTTSRDVAEPPAAADPESVSASALARAAEEGVVGDEPEVEEAAPAPATFSMASLARAAEEGVGDDIPPIEPPGEQAPKADPDSVEFNGVEQPPEEPAQSFSHAGGYDPSDIDSQPDAVESIEFDPPSVDDPAADSGEEAFEAAADDSADAADAVTDVQGEPEDLEVTAAAKIPPIEELAAEDELPPAAESDLEEIHEAEATELPEAAEGARPPDESEMQVEFDQTGAGQAEPVPLKRVKVSNQLDILAELDGLRKEATMSSATRRDNSISSELDLESLLSSPRRTGKDVSHTIAESLNSDIFERMRGLQVAIRIENDTGEVIHEVDPVSLTVDEAGALERLSLRFTVNLKNVQ